MTGQTKSWGTRICTAVLFLFVSVQVGAEPVLSDIKTGAAHELKEFTGQGKWLVVMFWAHDCHVCNVEAPNYQAFFKKHMDNDATIVGISIDGSGAKKAAKKFVSRNKLTFPNLIGEPEAVTAMFTKLTGAPWRGTPTFLIYTPSGKLVVQQAGGVPVSIIEEFIQEQTAAGSV